MCARDIFLCEQTAGWLSKKKRRLGFHRKSTSLIQSFVTIFNKKNPLLRE